MSEPKRRSRSVWLALQLLIPGIGAFLGGLVGDRPWGAEKPAPAAIAARPASEDTSAGPWGHLERSRVNLEPPRSLLYPELCPTEAPIFELDDYTAEKLLGEWTDLKLQPKTIERLASMTRCRTGLGCRVTPDLDLLRSFTRDERRAFYLFIDTLPIANDHTPFRRHTSDTKRWTERTKLDPKLTQLIEKYSYENGEATMMSDLNLLCAEAGSDDQRIALLTTLARMPTLLVKLHVDESDDPRALARYWNRGGRSKSLRPLLESLARTPGGGSIDLVHLLPSFARNLLYTYPTWDDPAYNCFWSSLNFFSEHPDDGFIDTDRTAKALLEHYEEVEMDELELGDVIAFLDREGHLQHTVSFIADDIVFTKNGMNVWRPWVLMPLHDVIAYYPRTTLVAYRLRGAPHPAAAGMPSDLPGSAND